MSDFANIDFGFKFGKKQAIENTSYSEGHFNIATDTGTLWVDVDGKRITLSTDVIQGLTELEIRALESPEQSKLYFASDTFNLLSFDYNTLQWRRCLGESVAYATSAEKDNLGNVIDTTYQTKADATSEVEDLVNSINALTEIVNTINRFNVQLLAPGESLPDIGTKFVIYLVPENSSTDEDNTYSEYIWIETVEDESTVGRYERIGSTNVNISNYYTKTEVDEKVSDLQDAISGASGDLSDNYYTKTQANNKFLTQTDASTTYATTASAISDIIIDGNDIVITKVDGTEVRHAINSISVDLDYGEDTST